MIVEMRADMDKVAIITDSNSGITLAEAEKLGIRVVPMPFLIDGNTYYEEISLSQEEFFKKLDEDVDISTSQPEPGSVTDIWEEELKHAEEVVYIPMSSGLSSSCHTAIMLSEDFDGKVQVVDNQRISVTQRQSVLDAIELAGRGMGAAEIKEYLENVKMESSIYIMLDTLKYLKKGGRITPAAAALGSALRLKPVLQIQGDKLDAFTIARTKKQGISKMLSAMESDINNRFGGVSNVHLEVAHTQNEAAALGFIETIKEKFGVNVVDLSPLSLSVSCHIGAGALAIACSKKIKKAD